MSPFQHCIRQPILYVNKRFSECKSEYFRNIHKQNIQFFQPQILKHCLSSPFKVWNSYYTFFFFLKSYSVDSITSKTVEINVACLSTTSNLADIQQPAVMESDVVKVSQSVAFVKELLRSRPSPLIPDIREIKMLPKTAFLKIPQVSVCAHGGRGTK